MLVGMNVVIYLFLGGCGAGALFATSAWSLAFHHSENRTFGITEIFNDLKEKGYIAGLVFTLLSSLFLLFDLGRPDKFYLLFTNPTFTPISLGSFFLLGTIVVVSFLVVANVLFADFIPAAAKKVAEAACVVLSFALMAYTGVFIGGVEGVALWATQLMLPLFVLSSLSGGIAVLLVLAALSDSGCYLMRMSDRLHFTHAVVIALELIVLVLFVVEAYFDAPAAESLALLFGPELGPWFVLGVGVIGLIFPLVSELVMARTGAASGALPLGVACLMGCFLLRFCIVAAGIH